jgi:hypothetical protein
MTAIVSRLRQVGAPRQRLPNKALKPTSRIGAILGIWMRNTVGSVPTLGIMNRHRKKSGTEVSHVASNC